MDAKQTYCVEGRHKSNTIDIVEYQKIKPKTKNVVKVRKGKSDNCGQSESQTSIT